MSNRSTKAEKLNRVSIVYRMLLSGCSRADIIEYGSKKWDVCERNVDKYIKEATDSLEKDLKNKKRRGLYYRLLKRELIFSKAMGQNNLNLCLEIERDAAKLEGLYIDKIDLKSNNTNVNTDLSHLETEDLKKFVNDLEKAINDNSSEKANDD